jgi:hypothetical protein
MELSSTVQSVGQVLQLVCDRLQELTQRSLHSVDDRRRTSPSMSLDQFAIAQLTETVMVTGLVT